jgi:DNA-binding HxlR family transcriptional regulator
MSDVLRKKHAPFILGVIELEGPIIKSEIRKHYYVPSHSTISDRVDEMHEVGLVGEELSSTKPPSYEYFAKDHELCRTAGKLLEEKRRFEDERVA